MAHSLQTGLSTTAFAFRGYNVTNLGRTPELLDHPAYGPVVARYLDRASKVCSTLTRRWVNLTQRVQRGAETTMRSYPADVAMIVAVELAQLKLLEEFFGVRFKGAQYAFGYSLGEVSALVAGGTYEMEAALEPLLCLAKEAAGLAKDVTMGVLFSRGPTLDMQAVQRLCRQITNEGRGVIAISTYLSPNTVLLLGQGETVERFGNRMGDVFPPEVHLRKNPNRWPPLHTPITWQKNLPARAREILDRIPGGTTAPQPPILSCVTGQASYKDQNSRELLQQWVDHPQRLWDVVHHTLAEAVATIVHVGPEPNIIPATYRRLNNNVSLQLSGSSLASFGRRAVSRLIRRRRPWLTNLLSADATLLRAPFVEHIVLEDWLLEQQGE